LTECLENWAIAFVILYADNKGERNTVGRKGGFRTGDTGDFVWAFAQDHIDKVNGR
jgi:hypothetical protein